MHVQPSSLMCFTVNLRFAFDLSPYIICFILCYLYLLPYTFTQTCPDLVYNFSVDVSPPLTYWFCCQKYHRIAVGLRPCNAQYFFLPSLPLSATGGGRPFSPRTLFLQSRTRSGLGLNLTPTLSTFRF